MSIENDRDKNSTAINTQPIAETEQLSILQFILETFKLSPKQTDHRLDEYNEKKNACKSSFFKS